MQRRPVLFYALCGEGMGHATRSWPVIRYLGRRYEVHVFAGGRVHEYLVTRVEHLHWIQTLALVYRDNQVDVGGSAVQNLRHFPLMIWSCLKFASLALAQRPHVLVTDFEALSTYMAIPLRLKTVAFDNQHVFGHTEVSYPARFEADARATARAIFWTIPHANRFVISNFFRPPVCRPHTRLIPPVVRPEVLALRPTDGDTVLVYQTSDSNTRLIPTLNRVAQRFIVYGLRREAVVGNCTLRTFSEARFLEDLASAKAVITNGGHTLISEALALGKPILSEPVRGQFEQLLNAIYLEKMGMGRFVDRLTEVEVQAFLDNLDGYRDRVRLDYPAVDNEAALGELEEAILELSPALRELRATGDRPPALLDGGRGAPGQ